MKSLSNKQTIKGYATSELWVQTSVLCGSIAKDIVGLHNLRIIFVYGSVNLIFVFLLG